MEWGTEGTDYGQFNEPHTLAFDSRGRLFVGDRINQRIQVFDQSGRFLAVWPAIMASGMTITPDDIVYVADYQLRQGIVIARASDFQEIGFIDNALGEGVAVDGARNVYVGEVIYTNLKKFVRSPAP
jgi:DNA-binding beta-propeller fold protein YncE